MKKQYLIAGLALSFLNMLGPLLTVHAAASANPCTELSAQEKCTTNSSNRVEPYHANFLVFMGDKDRYQIREKECITEIAAVPETIVSFDEGPIAICKGRVIVRGNGHKQEFTVSGGKSIELEISREKVISIDASGIVKDATLSEREMLNRKYTHSTEPVHLIAAIGSKFKVAKNSIQLGRGWFLVQASTANIRTDSLQIDIASPSIINVESTSEFERVGVCAGLGKIEVKSNQFDEKLELGRELSLLEKEHSNIARINNIDGILRRQFHSFSLQDGTLLVENDFSIFSMLSQAQHLEQLRKPSCDSDREVRDMLLKNCVTYELVSQKHGKYFR